MLMMNTQAEKTLSHENHVIECNEKNKIDIPEPKK